MYPEQPPPPADAETAIALRPFRSDDADRLFPWLRGAGLHLPKRPPDRPWIDRICNDPRILCVTGVGLSGRAVGFFRLDVAPDRTAEITLIVAPDRRRRGVGRALLEGALQTARERALRRVVAVIDQGNEAALTFFLQHGFEHTDVALPGHVHLARVVHRSAGQPPLEISV